MIHRGNKLSIICMGMCLMMVSGRVGGMVARFNFNTSSSKSGGGRPVSDEEIERRRREERREERKKAITELKENIGMYATEFNKASTQGQKSKTRQEIERQFAFINNTLEQVDTSLPKSQIEYDEELINKLIINLRRHKLPRPIPVEAELLEALKPLYVAVEEGQKEILSALKNSIEEQIDWLSRNIIIKLKEEQWSIDEDQKKLKKLNEEAQALSLGFGITKNSWWIFSRSTQHNLTQVEFSEFTEILGTEIHYDRRGWEVPDLSIQCLKKRLEETRGEICTIIKTIIMHMNRVIEEQSPGTERGADPVITSEDSIDTTNKILSLIKEKLSHKLSQMIRDANFQGMAALESQFRLKYLVEYGLNKIELEDSVKDIFRKFCYDNNNYRASGDRKLIAEISTHIKKLQEKYKAFKNPIKVK